MEMPDSARMICGKPVSRSENAKKSGTHSNIASAALSAQGNVYGSECAG